MSGFAASSLAELRQALNCNPGNTMPSNEEILSKLLSTLQRRFAIDTTQVDRASRQSDMGIDSLHLVDIMLDMEHEFSFRFESLQLPPNPSLEQISLAILRDSDTLN